MRQAVKVTEYPRPVILNDYILIYTEYAQNCIEDIVEINSEMRNELNFDIVIRTVTRRRLTGGIGTRRFNKANLKDLKAATGVRRYFDPHDILTPGSKYRNDISTPLTIFWPPL